jgi:hypothetical protein
MHELVADRFAAFGRTWIDVASGAPVRLRFVHAAQVSEEVIRNEQCAERARLRHPLMNVLLDYGVAGNGRMFEAYSIGEPLAVGGRAASELLRHAGRFLASRGLPLTAHASRHALREVVCAGIARTGSLRFSSGRPLGLILQPRAVIESLREALEVVSPGGTTSIEIAGGRGAGLRTARLLAARSARMAGLIPVASAVLVRLPSLRERLAGRHLCILLDDHTPAERTTLAMYLALMGTASARRHVLLRFTRTEAPHPGARPIDSMGIAAMTSMVFVDEDNGPSHEELFDAARGSAGRPGLFLERLRATHLGEPPVRIAVVHESSPAYVVGVPASARLTRGAGRVLRDAPDRGARLAARGRHASAIRLLVRASRVLEARGEQALAAACAGELAWILRGRGQSERAVAQFERVRAIAGDGATGIGAVVGIGVVWTDQRRFREAEASLRGACAAAALMSDASLKARASRALARCLYWQSRYDEAAIELGTLVTPSPSDGGTVEAWALLARSRAAMGDLRAALAAAGEAIGGAGRLELPRVAAAAFRSMAIVQQLVGDEEQVRLWSERSLRVASSGHLPLAGLRARCLLVAASRVACESSRGIPGSSRGIHGSSRNDGRAARWLGHLRSALASRPLPALLRQEIEDVCTRADAGHAEVQASPSDRALLELEAMLEMAHAAPDDSAALEAVCQHALDRLRAASVQIVTGPSTVLSSEPRTLARVGRLWQGDAALVTRVIAGGAAGFSEPRQAGEPIRFGHETIAVLCCRWTMGTVIDTDRASALLHAAALAASASVRSLLDRPAVQAADAGFAELLGSSEAAAALRASVVRAARAPFPVLVEGASGPQPHPSFIGVFG